MKIRIYGASDDLIEVEGCKGADEFYSYQTGAPGAPGSIMWAGTFRAPNGEQVRAYAVYGMNACWSIALGQVGEESPFPAWPVTIGQHADTAYSTMAEIAAPEGTELVGVWPGGED